MFVSVNRWRDLEDGHLYNAGDEYPHDGREIPEKRIKALSTTQNKAGFALIRAVDDPVKEKPKQTAEVAKKPVRSRRKAT